MRIPRVSPDAAMILKTLINRSNISGSELMWLAGVSSPAALIPKIKELKSENLIDFAGDALTEKTFPFASFGIVPSATKYLEAVIANSLERSS